MDPCLVIKKGGKSKLNSLSLSSVYKYIYNGKTLEGSHDSLVDARAQSDLLAQLFFIL